MGRRLARRPLLGLVQQAAQRRFPAGVETAFALDSDADCAGGVFGFWVWWGGGAALDCAVSKLPLGTGGRRLGQVVDGLLISFDAGSSATVWSP